MLNSPNILSIPAVWKQFSLHRTLFAQKEQSQPSTCIDADPIKLPLRALLP